MAEKDICSICLDSFGSGNKSAEEICKNHHRLCSECFDEVLTTLNHLQNCPQCRQPLRYARARMLLAVNRKQSKANSGHMNLSDQMILPPAFRLPDIRPQAPALPPIVRPQIQYLPRNIPVAVPADEPEPDVPETSCKTKIVRMLVVFIVVSQTFGNIMYYIRLAGTIESAFIAVLVYIFVLQLTVIAKHQPQMYATASKRENVTMLVRHILLYSIDRNEIFGCMDIIVILLQIGQLVAVIVIQINLLGGWDELAIAAAILNAAGLLNTLITKPHYRRILRPLSNYFVQNNFSKILLALLIILAYVHFGLVFLIFYLFSWQMAVGYAGVLVASNLLQAMHRCCQESLTFKMTHFLRMLLTVPFAISNLMNTQGWCFKALSGILFFYKYLVVVGFSCAVTVSNYDSRSTIDFDAGEEKKLQVIIFIMSLFSPMEMVLGSMIYPQ